MGIIAYLCICKPCKLPFAYTYDQEAVALEPCPKCGKLPCGEFPQSVTCGDMHQPVEE